MILGQPGVAEITVLGRPRAIDGEPGLAACPGPRERTHPRERLGAPARRDDPVEACAHTATLTPPSCSSGTGAS